MLYYCNTCAMNIFIDLPASSSNNTNMSDERVRKIVKEILQIYDADKTGQVDYALESAGIVSHR